MYGTTIKIMAQECIPHPLLPLEVDGPEKQKVQLHKILQFSTNHSQ
jgi:hypothetical protein